MDQAEAAPQLLIAGICGSLRPTSYTRMALTIALQGAREAGARTRLIDLQEYNLPFCAGKDNEVGYPEDVFRLRRAVQQAHGVILGTPEYHSSFSGVLKNALDLMGHPELEGKMIGLVGVSGGQLGPLHAFASLRLIGRSLHAWVIPDQVAIPAVRQAFDTAGKLRDPELERRLKHVGRQVARFAYLHNSQEAQAFLREWEVAVANPGGTHWEEQ